MSKGRGRACLTCTAFALANAITIVHPADDYDESRSRLDFLFVRLTVTSERPTQVAPRNTASRIRIKLAFSSSNAGVAATTSHLSPLPSELENVGELAGLGIGLPIKLRGPPGSVTPEVVQP